ncbi:MAG TPA: ATP synthase subunit I [Desulfobulbus sp.]|nr:ATP synthase subunit I [Desulfobulbus sp.]
MMKPEETLLRMVQVFSLLMTVVFTAGTWYQYDWFMARSVLIGGILAFGSFFILMRDARQITERVSRSSAHVKAVQKTERIRFLVKFYAKLFVFGLILYALSTNIDLHMIGLVLGLSTVMLSVIIVVLSRGRKIFSVQSC